MKVVNTVQIYEVDGEELAGVGKDSGLKVESHSINDRRVVLNLGGKRITVIASDLQNATNWRSY